MPLPPDFPPFQEVVGLDVQDSAVCGRSVQRAWDPICMPPGRIAVASLDVTYNRALQWVVKAKVDEEGGGLEVRVCDPFGTPVLEWRFEPSPEGMLRGRLTESADAGS